ncbi:MAG: hypothetical protein ACTSPY_16480 [Candidatus Helarchaeota archaeon]
MDENELDWKIQKKLNVWKDNAKYKRTIEELFNGNVRYLKFIKTRMNDQAVSDAFQNTVNFTYEKSMGPLTKLGAELLKKISKNILLKRIIGSFFINMQHVVEIKCVKKLEFQADQTEIIIDKCTAKKAWKQGLKNNNAKELFTDEDYCKNSCIPTLNKFLELTKARATPEFNKKGCHLIVKFIEV